MSDKLYKKTKVILINLVHCTDRSRRYGDVNEEKTIIVKIVYQGFTFTYMTLRKLNFLNEV